VKNLITFIISVLIVCFILTGFLKAAFVLKETILINDDNYFKAEIYEGPGDFCLVMYDHDGEAKIIDFENGEFYDAIV